MPSSRRSGRAAPWSSRFRTTTSCTRSRTSRRASACASTSGRPFTNEATLKFYGIGNATPLPPAGTPIEATEYERLHPTLSIEARYRVYEHFYLKLGSVYTQNWLTVRPGTLLAQAQTSPSPTVREMIGSFAPHGVELLELEAQYDSRDSDVVTRSGMFISATARVSPRITGELPYAYQRLTVSARFYGTPIRRWLSWSFRVVGDTLLGAPPFYELARFDETPAIGGGKALRGVPAQRYYGKVKLFENLEAQSELLPFTLHGKRMVLGVAAFVDAVAPGRSSARAIPGSTAPASVSSTAWAVVSGCRRARPSSSAPTWRGRPMPSPSGRTSRPARSSRGRAPRSRVPTVACYPAVTVLTRKSTDLRHDTSARLSLREAESLTRPTTERSPMNAIALLTSQQSPGREAALEIEAAHDGRTQRALFTEMADALAAHVSIEESLFYPAINAKRTEDILLESLEEHLSIKRILADLLTLPVGDATFAPKIKVLGEQVLHHHGDEEDDLFPKVKKMLSKDELEVLGEKMNAEFETLLARRPRDTVPSETKHAASL